MASRRLADTPTPARRRQAPPSLPVPPDDSGRTARDLLLRSWPGRLFIVAVIFKILILVARIFGEVPAFLQVLSTAATVALAFSVLFFLTRLVFLVQRRLLWRVRRKLILSYIFIGVVPALLILGFFLLSTRISCRHGRGIPVPGWLRRRHAPGAVDVGGGGARDSADRLAQPTRLSIACSATAQRHSATRRSRSRSSLLRPQTCPGVARAVGTPERPQQPSALAPTWVQKKNEGFVGTTSVTLPDAPDEPELVIRAINPAARPNAAPVGWVVVDLPLDAAMLNKLYQRTGVKAGLVTLSHTNEDQSVSIVGGQQQTGKKKPVDLRQHGHALRQL